MSYPLWLVHLSTDASGGKWFYEYTGPVKQELENAYNQGLDVVQYVWPRGGQGDGEKVYDEYEVDLKKMTQTCTSKTPVAVHDVLRVVGSGGL